MSGLAGRITSNGLFVFMVVMFAVVIIWNIPAMASFTTQIYDALTTSFEFLPLVALVGALAYMSGARGK